MIPIKKSATKKIKERNGYQSTQIKIGVLVTHSLLMKPHSNSLLYGSKNRHNNPIRSKIICEILFSEENYIDIYDYITNSINLINEEDLQIYLLESLHKGYSIFTCIETIKSIKF